MSPTAIKLTVIGAGSAVFSLGLVKDICLTTSLSGSEICFMDINAERLEMVHKMAARYAKELGADLRFSSTTDRRASLKDADFVINTADPVSHPHAEAMRDVAEKHGYYRGVRVSVGRYYQLKLMLDVARDMEEVCPKAWLIQSGNPVFDGCTLMTRETGLKIIGLCHGHYGYREIAETLGMDPDRVTWQAPGLNHNIWMTHFIYEGKDAYPVLDEWIATKAEEYWATHVAKGIFAVQMSRGPIHQYKMFGLMPIGDTPRRGGWWYHTSLEDKLYWFGKPYGGPDSELGWTAYLKSLDDRLAQIARLATDPKARVSDVVGTKPTREQQVPIIDGLVNNNEGYFQVNVPNHGALPGIPDDVVVEVPAIVNQKGVQPVRVEPLPPKIMLFQILPDWLRMERELLAFKTGDRTIPLWNVLDVHQTQSYRAGVALMEELMAMPGNEEMNAYYRYPKLWDKIARE